MTPRKPHNEAVETQSKVGWKGKSGWCVGVDDAQHADCPTTFTNGDCTCDCHNQ